MDNVYNEEDVKRKIAEIEKRFHLVMILEQFEVRLWINMNKLVYFRFTGVPDSDEGPSVLEC